VVPAALALALYACRRPTGGGAATEDVVSATAAVVAPSTLDARCAQVKPLEVAPLIVEWQESEKLRQFTLTADGRVKRGAKLFGRFVGGCLVDARETVVFLVDATGSVTGPDKARKGAFQVQGALQVEGKAVAVSEVLIDPSGDGWAVDDAGTVYIVSRAAEASSVPAHVEGNVARARRAAMLLLEARTYAGDETGKSTGEWPALQTGIWQLYSTRIPHSGKPQHWNQTVNQCSDARGLLTGYWGLGIVERAGCRQSSSKIEPTRFKVVSECMVRHAGKATSEAIVTIKSPAAFDLDVRVTEGKREYRGSQSGHRLSACPPTTDTTTSRIPGAVGASTPM
jgi:hypothetical protein